MYSLKNGKKVLELFAKIGSAVLQKKLWHDIDDKQIENTNNKVIWDPVMKGMVEGKIIRT